MARTTSKEVPNDKSVITESVITEIQNSSIGGVSPSEDLTTIASR